MPSEVCICKVNNKIEEIACLPANFNNILEESNQTFNPNFKMNSEMTFYKSGHVIWGRANWNI